MDSLFVLEYEGFTCPPALVNDFTPAQFEEMVTTFQQYDADGSGTIDLDEINKLLEELDMEHASDAAHVLLGELDVDGSGELNFDEFCDFFSRLQRGDSSLQGFNALAAAMNETPVAILEDQGKRRGLQVDFKVVEERAATSMHAAHYVVECTLTGLFYDKDKKGKPVKFVGSKVFQGIGKTTRMAREKSAQVALAKLKKTMPGMQVQAGEVPEKWLQWAHTNLDRGVPEETVLKTLIDKGFYPAQNHALMQALAVVRHLRHALEGNPQLFAGEETGDTSEELDAFLDQKLKTGFHGPVLLRTLEQFGFSASRNPSLVHRLKNSELAVGSRGRESAPQHDPNTRPEEQQRDWWRVCREGAIEELELYLTAGQQINARKLLPGWQGRTGLMAAAQAGHKAACVFLLQHHADPNLADAGGRTALHLAASKGHLSCVRALDQFGADCHLLDSHHNSPLHLAAAHNRKRAAKCLLEMEDDYQRQVLTGAIPAIPGQYRADGGTEVKPVTFEQLGRRAFAHLLEAKNHPKDVPRFRKDWVMEACAWVYDQFAPSQRRFITQPSHAHVELALATRDPDPESGFYYGARGREIWVKTVESVDLLLVVLTAAFRQAANHSQNKLGRSALHEACFENLVDSHRGVIDLMVNHHALNMEMVDIYGKRAIDELVAARRRPRSPTGLALREQMIATRREELVSGLLEKRKALEAADTEMRQAATLAAATEACLHYDRDSWDMVKTASQPKFRLDPFMIFEDPDTLNFFYVRRTPIEISGKEDLSLKKGKNKGKNSDGGSSDSDNDDDDEEESSSSDDDALGAPKAGSRKALRLAEEAKQAELAAIEASKSQAQKEAEEAASVAARYSWQVPLELAVRQRLKVAVETVRNRCEFLRCVKGWDMMYDSKLRATWWCHSSYSIARWNPPPECTWARLEARATLEGLLGRGGRWQVFKVVDKPQDKDGSGNSVGVSTKSSDNLVFYKDRLASLAGRPDDYRWKKPPDALPNHDDMSPSNPSTRPSTAGNSSETESAADSAKDAIALNTPYRRTRCTRFVFGSGAAEQAWYSSEALTALLKEVPGLDPKKEADRFRACLPCAHKLMKAVAHVKKMNARPVKKNDDTAAAKAALIVKRALDDVGHPVLGGLGQACEGLRYAKTSSMRCSVCLLPGLAPAGVGDVVSDAKALKAAEQCDAERKREALRRKDQPCVIACVPHQYAPWELPMMGGAKGAVKQVRGWNLCRRRQRSEVLFGWQAVHDPEPRQLLAAGEVVRAKRLGDEHGWHQGVVKQRRGNYHYDIAFAARDVQRKTPRSEIDAEGPVFWWHQQTAKSQWLPPEEIKPFELDRERKMAKALPKGSSALALPNVNNNAVKPGATVSAAPGADAALSSVRLTPPTSSRVPSRRGSRRLSVLGADGVAEVAAGGSRPGSRSSSRGSSRIGSRPNTPGSRPGTPGTPGGGGQFADVLGIGAGEDPESVATEDEAFMTRYHENLLPEDVPWPWLDGNEWAKDYVVRCGGEPRRIDLNGWDEYFDPDTGVVFYMSKDVNEEEEAARVFQVLLRQKKNCPISPFWESHAFTFDQPPEVAAYLTERAGWAALRRRSTVRRTVEDDQGRAWVEQQDSASGDILYTASDPRMGWSSWTSPQSQADKLAHPDEDINGSAADGGEGASDPAAASGGGGGGSRPGSRKKKKEELNARPPQAILHEGDRVLFKFAESPDLVDAVVVRCRLDEDTGERFYDIEDERNPELSLKWAPRAAIRLHPFTQDELDAQRQGKNMKLQLSRAREAETRREERDRAKAANDLRIARGKPPLGPGGVLMTGQGGGNNKKDQDKGLFQLSEEEMHRYRDERAALERAVRLAKDRNDRHAAKAKAAAAAHNEDNASNMGSGSAAMMVEGAGGNNGGAKYEISSDEGSSSSEEDGNTDDMNALSAVQGSGMSEEDELALLEAKERIRRQKEERMREREADRLEQLERESWLAAEEDRVTSPRTQRRRVLHRNMHRALMRQKDGFVICRWGCKQWIRAGQAEFLHQRELCPRRIIQCVLQCPCRKREEEWLAPYVPPKSGDDDSDSDANDSSSDDDDSSSSDGDTDGGGPSRSLVSTGDGSSTLAPLVTVQQMHEEQECPRRLVRCPRKCGEWVNFEDLSHHLDQACLKRPLPPLLCRNEGCGATFTGGAHRMVQCEEDRIEHEAEMCLYRIVRCTWKGCVGTFPAHQRAAHRQKHIIASGIVTYTVPGSYQYKVGNSVTQVKVQLWGGGGGSGHLVGQGGGHGGGGAYVEALVSVRPGETLEVTVGSGGEAGVLGSVVVTTDPLDPAHTTVADVLGKAAGGVPGGGNGHSNNVTWACGGGGGYSMVQRPIKGGAAECLALAGGGGGGGWRNGGPGGGLNGELPGTKLDRLCGRMGRQDYGGAAGDSGDGVLCEFPSQNGSAWTGGNGASFGGGGGGGYFGGGGGGAAPGIVGGGGGGSSFYLSEACADVVFLQGDEWRPGGWSDPALLQQEDGSGGETSASFSSSSSSGNTGSSSSSTASTATSYNLPDATGAHELSFSGGKAGEGGQKDLFECRPGKNGAVRILRPGFYVDHNPKRFQKPYMGDPRRQEMLLPIGTPVATVLDNAAAAGAALTSYNDDK